jgi:uncharacterized membrane protein (DUF4010 family)
VDAITLSAARLFTLGQLSAREASIAITIALLANLLFKFGIVTVIGGGRLARACGLPMLAMVIGATMALAIF